MNGRPLDLRWAAENVPAILDIWYPGTPGRRGRRRPAVRRGLARRQAAVQLAAHGRAGADDLLAHALPRAGEPGTALLGRGQHAAVPVRARPQLRPVHYSDLAVDRQSVVPDGTVTVSVEVTNASDREADRGGPALPPPASRVRPPDRCASSRASSASPSPAGRRAGRVHARPEQRRYWSTHGRDWVLDDDAFDVWVGGDSTAQLSTTFRQDRQDG